ncbi:beta strand repeat-containing protein [Terriglobus tenax]|uniref:beta strand repeat-containing protein n=1 Tax=Terriglobus tenax TaxID=1111115 RepID=UPI0021DFAD3F|nr:putative Ig domain-containing protein [Terriglobus tenax]
MNAGQSIQIPTSSVANVSWSVNGTGCSSGSCGSVAPGSGAILYTAPQTVATQLHATINASMVTAGDAGSIAVTVNPALTVAANLDSASVGVPYTGAVTTSGGSDPVQSTVASGSLPTGLTFDSTAGKVVGTPSSAGMFTFTIKTTDASNAKTNILTQKSIRVSGTSTQLSVVTASLPKGTVGSAYAAQLTATGGTAPYTWSIVSGSLPAGVTVVSSSGILHGMPTASGTFPVSVQATDSNNAQATASLTMTVANAQPTLQITTTTLASGTVGVAYTSAINTSGGTAPYRCAVASGSLPAGLALNGCTINGTPTASGSFSFTVTVTDATGASTSGSITLTIAPSSLRVTTTSLSSGTVGKAYTQAITAAGGTSPYTCSIRSGTLPNGLALSGCNIAGTPTAAGSSTLVLGVTDAAGISVSSAGLGLTIADAAPTLTVSSPTSATVGVSYSASIGVTGGTAPYSCSLTSGSLPEGISLSNCSLRGTPTTAGVFALDVSATDSSTPAGKGSGKISVVVENVAPTLSITSPATVTAGQAYNGSIGVTGGSAPYTCSLVSGSLPSGLSLNNCGITGVTAVTGSSSLVIKATDASSPAGSATSAVTLTVVSPPATLTISSPPSGTVGAAYNGTISVSGGTSPYTCALANGSVPAGLTLAGCSLRGTPTAAGNTTFAIRASDASSPANSTTAPVTLSIAAAPVTLTLTAPPAGTAGAIYSGTIAVSGGTAPYSCSLASGAMPSGLTLNGCVITGTPVAAGTFDLSIKATDASNPANTTIATVPFTIAATPVIPVTLTLTAPTTTATVGSAYAGIIGVSGGTAPYTCSLASGSVPGLTLSNCTLTGTPTTAGTYSLSVRATDAATPANSITSTVAVTVNAAPAVTLTLSSPSAGTVGSAYAGIIGVSGGTAPYTCSLASGSVPGLSLSNCTLTGRPTTAGTYSLSVRATDAATPANSTTGTIAVTVRAAAVNLTLTAPTATATVGTAYTGTIGVAGGTAPYACALASGSVPGLALSNCTLTGTPTTAGTYSLSVRATDAATPANSATGTIAVTVRAAAVNLTLTAPTATATVGSAYTGTIGVAGGTAPYTCALTSGSVPGLTLSNCTLTGTPTTAGTYSLSVKATDAATPVNSTTGMIAVTVNAAPTVTLTLSSPSAGTVGTAYTGTIGVSGGTAPYTCSLSSGTVPAGLTLSNCSLSGTPTAAGITTLSIQATDSSSPAASKTGTVTLTINAAPISGSSGGPHINYTDINVGSGTGGDTGNGVYVRIFGSNFGATQGSSTVSLGGSLVTNCSLCSWSDTVIIAQLGSAAKTGNIIVTVNGLSSNGMPFTVTATDIVFVSPNGADTNTGSFTSPYKTWRAAFNSVTSSDSSSPVRNTVIYLMPGTDVSFDDGRSYKAAISTDIGGTSATSQLNIVGYPGGTVNVGSTSVTNGVKGWGKYITVANLNIVGQVSAIDAEAGNVRIINNSLSCPAPPSGVGGTACVLGETTDPTETWAFHGNNVHDTGGNVDKTYHAVYFSSNVNHADIGWNNVGQNFKGYCRGIMFHATLGSNQYDLHIHDNIVTNSYCDGIGLASVNPSQGTVEIYNNLVLHTALANNPYGVANEAGIAINSDPAAGTSTGNVEVYNNTVVDAGAYTKGNQNGCFGVVYSGAGMHLTNNICSQPSSAQPYVEKGSTNVSGSYNLWYGAGAPPSWDANPINADPLFTSTTNFSLQSGSPAKSAGTTSNTSTIDIVGTSRGSKPSMGAYQ